MNQPADGGPEFVSILIPTGIRWIVFDAVGTLIRPEPSVAIAYHSIAARHGSRMTVDEVGSRFHVAFQRSETDGFPNGPPAGLPTVSNQNIEIARWKWIVGQVVPDIESPDRCFQELWNYFSLPTSWSCFDDVESSLHSLATAGYRLAIASNFDARLHSVCDGLRALNPIERRFASSEIGFRKPAPEFFTEVVKDCGSSAAEILMIGDDPEHDVAGSVTVGMKALLIDRRLKNSQINSLNTLSQLCPR